MLDFETMSVDDIRTVEAECKTEIQRRSKNRHVWLASCAEQTGDELLKDVADAMLHTYYGVKPRRQKLAYHLADHHNDPVQNGELGQILKLAVDVDDYVFRFTHYDECYNGRFFRRS